MSAAYRWAWFGLVAASLLTWLSMHRYEPVGDGGFVWDRIEQKMCVDHPRRDMVCD